MKRNTVNLKHYITAVIMWVLPFVMTTSCIHEYPDGDGIDPSVVHTDLTFTTSSGMELYPLIKTETTTETIGLYRFRVCYYENDFNGEPALEKEIYALPDATGNGTVTIREDLHARKYKIAVWVEWVSFTGEQSPVYNSEKLQAITFKGDYVGNTEKKICFSGTYDMDLSKFAKERFAEITESHTVGMPLAQVQLVSTDLKEFIDLKAQRAMDEYIVRWDYVLYFPTGFNVFTQKPNDAELNIGFETLMDIYQGNPEKADMGMDYVFINGNESQVCVNLTVYDSDGNRINTYQNIEIPIKRGFKTIIEGRFLMFNKITGIGINPDFDGEFNIVLP